MKNEKRGFRMGYTKDVEKHESDKHHAVWSACDGIVEAWEKLEGGRNHSPSAVEHWLAVHMSPAINKARRALGRKAPNE
jgi:hypothetical protein